MYEISLSLRRGLRAPPEKLTPRPEVQRVCARRPLALGKVTDLRLQLQRPRGTRVGQRERDCAPARGPCPGAARAPLPRYTPSKRQRCDLRGEGLGSTRPRFRGRHASTRPHRLRAAMVLPTTLTSPINPRPGGACGAQAPRACPRSPPTGRIATVKRVCQRQQPAGNGTRMRTPLPPATPPAPRFRWAADEGRRATTCRTRQ